MNIVWNEHRFIFHLRGLMSVQGKRQFPQPAEGRLFGIEGSDWFFGVIVQDQAVSNAASFVEK